MSDTNTVVIISNRQELIKQVSQKLVLLRNLDKIKSCSIEEAQNMFDNFTANVLILHCEKNDIQAINLIKKLKKQEIYENIPILLLNENCSRETIIEAFDNGVSDVLFMPIIDYELLIRIIWCLQKNELSLNIESRKNFLTTLGIVQETGAYSQKYCNEFLNNEISQTKKYSQRACILLISPDKKYPTCKSPKDFIEIIKKSIRLNDSIAIKDVDKYYVYLQKTKLNGAYSVFERINNNLGVEAGANAGVVEVLDQKTEDIIEALDDALEKANENTNSLIVASDFYMEQNQPKIEIDSPEEIFGEDENEEDTQLENVKKTKAKYDKASLALFNQSYKRKIKYVITPVFQKYEKILKIKQQDFDINTTIGTKSIFSVKRNNVNLSFVLEYNGVESVLIKLSVMDNDQKKLYETETIDFTILDCQRLSKMLSELINKYIRIIKKK